MAESTDTETRHRQDPTEETPERGVIAVGVGDRAIEVSEVQHWTEHGVHVFRSTEFDCIAEAASVAEAVVAFIASTEDLFRFLDDLLDAGRATDEETRTLVKLSRRFFEVSHAVEQEEARRHAIIRLRRNLQRPQWHRQTAPDSSSKLLPA